VERPAGFAEILRERYAAFSAGDVGSALDFIAPDIEVEINTERPDVPEGGVFREHEGFLQNLRELTEPFEDFRTEVEGEIVEVDDRLMVKLRATGRGRASNVPIERVVFHVWTVRDGRAVRLQVYSERERAEAALRPTAGS
jgi:ketosteroid isomerase-like protein